MLSDIDGRLDDSTLNSVVSELSGVDRVVIKESEASEIYSVITPLTSLNDISSTN